MDDWTEGIGQILGDPEAMAGILSMAKRLGLGGAPAEPAPQPDAEPQADAAASPPELAALLAGATAGGGRETALLQALRPFLREDRREKLDRAVRAARISHLAGAALRSLEEKT